MTEVENWRRLAEHVVARRAAMGHRSQAAFQQATGFGGRTLGDLERGDRTNYSGATLARLDLALGWAVGSARRVLRGGDPIVSPSAQSTEVDSPESGTAVLLTELMDELQKVTPAQREASIRIALDVVRAVTEQQHD